MRHKDITDSIDSSFDPEKIAEWFKDYAAGIKPKRVVTFDILEKCRKDIRRLVLVGIGPAEIAKGFAQRGLQVSAATMKLFIDLRIKLKRKPKQNSSRTSPDTHNATLAKPVEDNSDPKALPDEGTRISKIRRM